MRDPQQGLGIDLPPPGERSKPCQQDLECERFRQVIVRAGIQAPANVMGVSRAVSSRIGVPNRF